MAANSDLTPRFSRNGGFDLAALGVGRVGGDDEVARLRAALETLVDLLVERGIVDEATLQARLGDLLQPQMLPVALGGPLPPPAHTDVIAARPVAVKPAAKPAPVEQKPAVKPAPVEVKPAARPAPVAVEHKPVAAAPVEQKPVEAKPVEVKPVAAEPKPVVAAPRTTGAHPTLPAPAPAAVVRAMTPAQGVPVQSRPTTPAHGVPARPTTPAQGVPVQSRPTTPAHGVPARPTTPAQGVPVQSRQTVQGIPIAAPRPAASPSAPTLLAAPAPVVAPAPVAPAPAVVKQPVADKPRATLPAEPAWAQVAKRTENRTPTPLPVAEPYRAEQKDKTPAHAHRRDKTPAPMALGDDVPSLKPRGFLSGLFARKKKPVAAIAAKAGKIEFTERVPKISVGSGLYSGEERRTELAFPAPEVIRKQRAAAAAAAASRKKQPAKKQPSPQMEGPARFCDRCWRRLDSTGVCKTCPTA